VCDEWCLSPSMCGLQVWQLLFSRTLTVVWKVQLQLLEY
jgi:hypothetical protein